MPFKSQAQRRFLWAKHPSVAQEFADKTPKGKHLPVHLAMGGEIGKGIMADKKSGGIAALIMAKRKPEMPMMDEEQEGESMGLEAAAQDLINAMESKDAAATATALRNAFSILEGEPHEEGSHTGEEGEG